jgi:hypothetical protein
VKFGEAGSDHAVSALQGEIRATANSVGWLANVRAGIDEARQRGVFLVVALRCGRAR